jgi:hypothetical protein
MTMKTRVMAFHGKNSARTEIVTDDNSTEQAAHFKYAGCDVTYEMDSNVNQKNPNFQTGFVTVCRTLKGKTRQHMKLRCHSIIAISVLL